MEKEMKNIVISASRRSDIPAFYLQWFLSSLKKGIFSVQNPFSKKVQRVVLPEDKIHSIIFWSKNYEELIKRIDELKKFNLYFHFTINSESSLLQPNVPPLRESLSQLEFITEKFSSDSVSLRFDPIIFYEKNGRFFDNLCDFEKILSFSHKLGIKFIITSFMSHYPKIDRREKRINNFKFIYPSFEEKAEHLKKISEIAESYGIKIHLCCEKELVELGIKNTQSASCINVEHLINLYGEGPLPLKDKTQRRSKGCGCQLSVDIGSYGFQPCLCGCLYCYANRGIC